MLETEIYSSFYNEGFMLSPNTIEYQVKWRCSEKTKWCGTSFYNKLLFWKLISHDNVINMFMRWVPSAPSSLKFLTTFSNIASCNGHLACSNNLIHMWRCTWAVLPFCIAWIKITLCNQREWFSVAIRTWILVCWVRKKQENWNIPENSCSA